MKIDLKKNWNEYTYVSFDTETTGVSPIGDEICEIAGVKWKDGKEIGEFQTLLKPTKPMTEFVISIHGITNEMVASAPLISEKIEEFHSFIQDTIPIAHHAPFDMGFVGYEFERANLPLPVPPVLCSSLLARAIIPEAPNHRLQTLIPFLGITLGTAHRALDDSRACLQVAIKAMQRLSDSQPKGAGLNLEQVFEKMGGPLFWQRFSIAEIKNSDDVKSLLFAIKNSEWVKLLYSSNKQFKEKKLRPFGIIRNPQGDYAWAYDPDQKKAGRFYLDRMKEVMVLPSL